MSHASPRILLVDDEIDNLRAIERTLRGHFETVGVISPLEALKIVQEQDFAVVISDQRMPDMSGTDFLAKVASLRPMITRVILTAFTETKEILDAINGAEIFRYVTKPWDNQEMVTTIQQAAEYHRLRSDNATLLIALEVKNDALVAKEEELTKLAQQLETQVESRTAELQKANQRLSELAMTDPLTKVLNRRAFFNRFAEELERGKRYTRSGVVAMIDVDHFKPFNDMEGHVFGDEALRKAAQIFTSNLRKTDVLGRYGGEEFIVLMPETKIVNALEICERLRATVERTTFQGSAGPAYLTISIGLAEFPTEGELPEDLVKAADQALYHAKQNGRNRVVHGDSDNASFFIR